MLAEITGVQWLDRTFCFYLHRLKCLWSKISISDFQGHHVTGTKSNKEMLGAKFAFSVEYANCWRVSESTSKNSLEFSSALSPEKTSSSQHL